MKTDVTTVWLETSAVEAIGMMQRFRIGCLPVVQDGRLEPLTTGGGRRSSAGIQ